METVTRDFFYKLLSIRDELFCILAPEGEYSLLEYIRKRLSERYILSVERKIQALINLGYLQPEYDENLVLIRLKIIETDWNPGKMSPLLSLAGSNAKFAILVDYKNLEDNIQPPSTIVSPEILKDFFLGLETQIIRCGKIIFPFVFIPDHYIGRSPVGQLSNTFHYFPIVCLRRMVDSGSFSKDADTVDTKMNELGRNLIMNSDITDLVIISGDADFHSLSVEAARHQKRVHVISTPNALSGRFVDISGFINVQLTTPDF